MLALRLFWREWRSGNLAVLVFSLLLSVAIVSGMLTFTGQVKTALNGEAARFLAADRVLASSRPIPPQWLDTARSQGLQVAHFATFPSMVFAGDVSALAGVKAVSAAYPLRGELSVALGRGAQAQKLRHGPAPGSVWLDSRLLHSLQVQPGDTVTVGDKDLVVAGVLLSEPDGGNTLAVMAPRLMMADEDLAATGVVQPGSRVDYSALFAGSAVQLDAFAAAIRPQLQSWQRWLDLQQDRPGLARALDRSSAFLVLSGSLAVLLAAVAAWMASRHYARSQRHTVAVLKTLGADRRRLRGLYAGLLLCVGVMSVSGGCLTGGLLQSLLRFIFTPLLTVPWPPAGMGGYLAGAATGVLCLLGFVWPLLWRLENIAPDSLLREAGEHPERDLGVIPGLLLLCALVSLLSGNWQVGVFFLGAVLASGGVLLLVLRLLLRAGRVLRPRPGGAGYLALSAWQRRPWASVTQVMVFALAFILTGTVSLVRTSLLDDWQMQLPEDAPNYFLVNIAPHEQAGVADFLAAHHLHSAGLYPMIRGRLTTVNGVNPLLAKNRDESLGWSIDRELNLSWAAQLPPDNRITLGQWWPAMQGEGIPVSVEAQLAARLNLKLGDRVAFNIAGASLEARVASIRKLEWESMRPNFYFMFPPGVMDAYPATWMTSFHLPAGEVAVLADLAHRFPTVSILDVGGMIGQVRTVIDQVSLAMALVFGLMLVAGVLVLLAALQASLAERRWEFALLKSLGAEPVRLRRGLWLEFACMGALAGLIGALGAETALWQVASRALNMQPVLHPGLWLLLPCMGAILVAVAGYWRLRPALAVPPARILQGGHTGA